MAHVKTVQVEIAHEHTKKKIYWMSVGYACDCCTHQLWSSTGWKGSSVKYQKRAVREQAEKNV